MDAARLPPWPPTPPAHGGVLLRAVQASDAAMAQLSTNPYVPTIGTLPPDAGEREALTWVRRQQGRHSEGAGFSFTPDGGAGRLHPGGTAA